jgi:hypothetical protein
MKLELVVPLLTGEPAQLEAISATTAAPEDGYVRVKINGAYVKIVECGGAADPGQDRLPVTATNPPALCEVCTKPPWKQFDNVTLEAYLDNDTLQDTLKAGVPG